MLINIKKMYEISDGIGEPFAASPHPLLRHKCTLQPPAPALLHFLYYELRLTTHNRIGVYRIGVDGLIS